MTDRPRDEVDLREIMPRVIEELENRRRKRRNPEVDPILWWPARAIAEEFRIRAGSSPDSMRRGARKLMEMIAEKRDDLVASFSGYGLGSTAADFRRHREWRRRMGLHHLADASRSKRSTAQADATGQLALATPPRKRRKKRGGR